MNSVVLRFLFVAHLDSSTCLVGAASSFLWPKARRVPPHPQATSAIKHFLIKLERKTETQLKKQSCAESKSAMLSVSSPLSPSTFAFYRYLTPSAQILISPPLSENLRLGSLFDLFFFWTPAGSFGCAFTPPSPAESSFCRRRNWMCKL